MRLFIFFGLLIILSLTGIAQTKGIPFGINICGAEFEEKIIPGVLNKDYAYPSESDIEYFYQQGFQLMTIPFKWERVQTVPGGDLNQENIEEIRRVLMYCAPRNIKVILTMHNFGRYRIAETEHIVGGNTITRNHFTDFWIKMARALKNEKNIYGFEIMSEPHDMGEFDWFTTAQEAINGIRTIDKKTAIIISGDNYANADKWYQYSDVLKNLTDPSNSIIYDAHCYFDKNFSGRYSENYDNSEVDEFTGVMRTMPFVRWLKDNNKQGTIGEYGVPDNDLRWLKLLDNFLKYLSENNINGCYWAAGSRWDKYPLSVQPNFQEERPQMEVLLRYKKTNPNKNSSFSFLLPETFLFLPNSTLLPNPKGGVYAPASVEKKLKTNKNNN